jgi:hypothetical protein
VDSARRFYGAGLSLLVLLDLTYPFSGDLSLSSESFPTGALGQFFRQR